MPASLAATMDGTLFQALNALAGRSWAVDGLIGLGLDNVAVKAGPIGACFLYAWYKKDGADEPRRRRLLVTLLSLLLIAPLSKLTSESLLTPRPFLLAEQSYALRDGRLAEVPPTAFRPMTTGPVQTRIAELHEGRLDPNDMAGFPSDHAALFIALSLGIFLACRGAGVIALGWTLLVTLGSRVAAGMHSPLDILVGGLAGAALLALLQLAFAGRRGRWLEPVVQWTGRYPGLTAGFLFLALLEAANTMQTLKRIFEIVAAVGGRLL